VKTAWLLRGRHWRHFHVHRCLKCSRKFADDEPGSWTGNRSDEFPELCRCDRRDLRREIGHTDCKAWGPYCPACAPLVEGELVSLREAYGA
jgi:hypothetical protein